MNKTIDRKTIETYAKNALQFRIDTALQDVYGEFDVENAEYTPDHHLIWVAAVESLTELFCDLVEQKNKSIDL